MLPHDGRVQRVVLDMQACQTEGSRTRGIGRYTSGLTKALIAAPAPFSFSIAVNEVFAASADDLAGEYASALGADRVVRYAATKPAGPWNSKATDLGRLAGEWIAQYAWLARKPDLIHVNSVFEGFDGLSVVPSLAAIPKATVVSATAYDVIPLLFSDVYLTDARTHDWYVSRIDRLRRCDVILAISEATRRDLIERVGVAPDTVVNVRGAADGRFSVQAVSGERRRELLDSLGITKPYVMYTGGIDHRKNIEGLIRAYALLPPEVRGKYQLAIVCSVNEIDRVRLNQLAKSRGLARNIVMTGYVDDRSLVDLYRCCELFVFPSLYEGFGLPVLEAMSCGAPTIAARASSLPEIVGLDDALFSVDSDEHIAAALARALTDEGYRALLRSNAVAQSREFSWERTAQRARDSWVEAISRKTARIAVDVPAFRARLALVSPLLPERSGIADYVTELLPHLARHFDIDLFCSNGADAAHYRALGYTVRAWQELPGCWLDYDAGVLYQVGNSEFHTHMLPLLRTCPGTVLLHDAYLSGLMAYCEFGPPRLPGFFKQMLSYCHGEEAAARYASEGIERAIDEYPATRWVADSACGLIVTSNHALELLLQHSQIDGARCSVVQLARSVRSHSDSDRNAAKEELGIPVTSFLVCTFGLAHERKLSVELLEAWLRRVVSPTGRLVFVGQADGAYGDMLRKRIGDLEKSRNVSMTGYVSDDVFHKYMKAADVVVQLRDCSRGEASSTALYAMAYGSALVASRHGSLAEIPDDACMHVESPLEVERLTEALSVLAADEERRRTLGRNAQEWIRVACDADHVASMLATEIRRFNDPEISQRDGKLAMRLQKMADATGEDVTEWMNDVQRRARLSESARDRSDGAQSILTGLMRLQPEYRVSDLPLVDQGGRASRDSVFLRSSDKRLMTVCGIKADSVIRTNGTDGVLLYGPYIEMAAGIYRVRVYGECNWGSNGAAAKLEAVANGGRWSLGDCELRGMVQGDRVDGLLGRLDFTVPQAVSDLEVRIVVSGETDMVIESLDIVALTQSALDA